MWPALRMATEKNVRRRARLLLLLRLRSLEDVRARERSDDDDVWRVARGRRADGATASGSADRRSEERGERESDLQRRRSPALPLPENRPSASASPSPLFPLPNQFGRAVGVERKQERPRVVRPLLDPPAASSSPPLHPVSTRSAVRPLARFRPFLQRCWIEIKTPLLLLRPRSDRSE